MGNLRKKAGFFHFPDLWVHSQLVCFSGLVLFTFARRGSGCLSGYAGKAFLSLLCARSFPRVLLSVFSAGCDEFECRFEEKMKSN